jgi:acyl phosphate:glycerol-3-phosphate acyltransferase
MAWIEQIQSADWSEAGWLALGAYLLGGFTTGYYVVRHRTGQDLRELGSGNLGARNAGRILGASGFLITLFGDFAKGVLAVWVAQHFTRDSRVMALCLLAVVAGHLWPVQLGFRGGKGVATSLGALLFYDFHLALAFALLFAGAFVVARRVVLPALFAFTCLPLVSLYLSADPGARARQAEAALFSILAGLILVAHRKNILEEIAHYTEPRRQRSKRNRS